MSDGIRELELAYEKIKSQQAYNEGYCKALFDLTIKTTESVDLLMATEYESATSDAKLAVSKVEGFVLDNAKKLLDLRRTEYERSSKGNI